MVLFPRKGDRLRAHSVFFQATRVAGSGKGVVSGMTPSRASSSSVAIASGSWSDGSGLTSYAGGTISSIPAASSGMHRYDLIVLDTSTGLVSRIAGSENTPTVSTDFLENIQPLPPELVSANQILIAIVIVTSSGIPSGNFGHYATGGVANLIIDVPNPQTHGDISLGARIGAYLRLYDNGVGGRLGMGIRDAELQSFIPAACHYSWNVGGDLQESGTNELARLTGAGNFGIGCVPSAKLHVKGSGVGTGGGLLVANSVSAGTWGFITGTDDKLYLKSSGGAQIVVDPVTGAFSGMPPRKGTIPFIFGDSSMVIQEGWPLGSCEVEMPPFATKITACRIHTNEEGVTGSITCKLYKRTFTGGYTELDQFVISSAERYEETGLSIAINASDWLLILVSGVSTFKQITCSLTVEEA